MRPIVKICGLMRAEDVQMCIRHGVDILGFVVDYPSPVPWNLCAGAAKKLIETISRPTATKTCVVTGGPPDKTLHIAMETKPDYIQLHCGESLEDTIYLVNELKKRDVKIIKTIFPNTPDLAKTAADFCSAGVYALLLDPRAPDNALCGGAANLFDFEQLQSAVSCPVFLAGGITPENAASITIQSKARFIDLMTGVELRPGIKDEAKVSALFQALRPLDISINAKSRN